MNARCGEEGVVEGTSEVYVRYMRNRPGDDSRSIAHVVLGVNPKHYLFFVCGFLACAFFLACSMYFSGFLSNNGLQPEQQK